MTDENWWLELKQLGLKVKHYNALARRRITKEAFLEADLEELFADAQGVGPKTLQALLDLQRKLGGKGVSRITDVIVIAPGLDEENEQLIGKINAWLSEHCRGQQLCNVTQHAGGTKVPMSDQWVAGVNHLPVADFIEFCKGLRDKGFNSKYDIAPALLCIVQEELTTVETYEI